MTTAPPTTQKKPPKARRKAAKAEPSRTALVRRARRINRELGELYPDAHTELNFTTPLELLVATILSAQTTDKRVNMVTPVLFARYRSAADYAAADRDEVEKIIVTTGFFRAKTTAIHISRLAVGSFLLGVGCFLLALLCFLAETVVATRLLNFHMLR